MKKQIRNQIDLTVLSQRDQSLTSKGNPQLKLNRAQLKSPRFPEGKTGQCHNPLCRALFQVTRHDQRFFTPKCKTEFFKIKYGLVSLAAYFDADKSGIQSKNQKENG